MIRKITGIITAAALTLPLIPTMMPAALAAEKGTYTKITTADDLRLFAQEVNEGKDYTGMTVVLRPSSGNSISIAGSKWNPIGSAEHKFTGTFDGKGNTIEGLTITSQRDYAGLFGYVQDGTVKNLQVSGSITVNSSDNVGGIVGYLDGPNSKVSCCGSYVNITAATTSGQSPSSSIGGVVGFNSNGTVENSYNTGAVSGGANVGGVVGKNMYGSIIHCHDYGDVSISSGSDYGAVVGSNDTDSSGTVSRCYYPDALNIGGYGQSASLGGEQVSGLAVFTDSSRFVDWDFDNIWKMGSQYPVLDYEKICAWDDRIEDLSELEELRDMVNDGTLLTKYPDFTVYYLVSDIDMSSIDNWTPIGINYSHPFSVEFDGKNYTISGLTVTGESDERGLFGYVTNGKIRDLSVKGNVQGKYNVGIIAGIIKTGSELTNCRAEGDVSGFRYAGGIAGFAENAKITGCTYTGSGTIMIDESFAGGIVGKITSTEALSGCIYAGTGSIRGESSIGGIAGFADCDVTDCNNSGSASVIASGSVAGGIVGNYYSHQMKNCNNIGGGTVKSEGAGSMADASGIVGHAFGSEIVNCKNTGAAVSAENGENAGGIAGYLSGTVTGCENSGVIRAKKDAGGIVGDNSGTVEKSNNTGSVTGGGNIGGIVGYGSGGEVTGCGNTGRITGSSKDADSIGGIAGLNSAAITGYCHNSGEINTGVNIGGIVGKNTGTTELCYNTGTVGGENAQNINVGGVAGSVDDSSAKLQNCYSTGDVYGVVCGGVVGISIGTVENCYSYALVAGFQSVGGVIGTNNSDNGRIISCYACDVYDSPRNIYGSTKGYIDDNSRKLTAEEFLDETNFIGWDFNNTSIWTINKTLGAPDFFDMKLTDSGEKSTGYYTDADGVYHENATGFIVNFKNGAVSPEKAYVGWKVTPEGGETITFEPSAITGAAIGPNTALVIGLVVTELEDENAQLSAYALYE